MVKHWGGPGHWAWVGVEVSEAGYEVMGGNWLEVEIMEANAEGQVVELASLVWYTKEENIFLAAQLREVEEEARFYSSALSEITDFVCDRHHWDSERAAQGILSDILTEYSHVSL
jgi:hypothetical protein